MELTNEFRVPAGIDRAWQVLTDVERIAPCLPGAELLESDGETYRGAVKVKVGPIRTLYHGSAHFERVDPQARVLVVIAEGRDSHGQGTAGATITVQLGEDGDQTLVTVGTDLQITGKVAQFGRSVMADVSDRLMAQFAENLRAEVLANPLATPMSAERDQPPAPVATGTPPRSGAEHVDLLASATPVLARWAFSTLLAVVFLRAAWMLSRRTARR